MTDERYYESRDCVLKPAGGVTLFNCPQGQTFNDISRPGQFACTNASVNDDSVPANAQYAFAEWAALYGAVSPCVRPTSPDTGFCPVGSFCPNAAATRGQMARNIVAVTMENELNTDYAWTQTNNGCPAVVVTLSQSSQSTSGSPVQFTAYVNGIQSNDVRWTMSPGSNYGFVDANGKYFPPTPLPIGAVFITATSLVNPTQSAQKIVTFNGPTIQAVLDSSTSSLGIGKSAKLSSAVGGTTNPLVSWSSVPTGTLATNGTEATYTAPVPFTAGQQTVAITVTSQQDSTKSATKTISLTPAVISLSPSSGSGASAVFIATFSNAVGSSSLSQLRLLFGQ